MHFAFHGCGSPVDYFVSEDYGDLNILAATNDIIIVYPGSEVCFNDRGRFDSELWLTKKGLYPETMMAMICRVTSADEESANCPPPGIFSDEKTQGSVSLASVSASLLLALALIY